MKSVSRPLGQAIRNGIKSVPVGVIGGTEEELAVAIEEHVKARLIETFYKWMVVVEPDTANALEKILNMLLELK